MTRFSFFFLAILSCFAKVYNKEIVYFSKLGTVYIAEDKVNVYENPTTNSKLLLTLEILNYVNVINKTNIILPNREAEEWYFVDCRRRVDSKSESPILKGWIQRKYLAGKGDFKRQTKTKEMLIKLMYPDFSVYWHIDSKGNIEYLDLDVSDKIQRGKLYFYKNIISLDFYDFLYYDENSNLRSRFATEVTVFTDKSKFPKWAQSDTPPAIEEYAILTGDNVNVRGEATTNSRVLLQLKKGAKVKVLERSDVEFVVGDKTGYWVYIDTGVKDKKGKAIKGWVVDIYLKPEE